MGTEYKAVPQTSAGPALNYELANFSVTDHTFDNPTRGLNCSADGFLKVDGPGLGTGVTVAVNFGTNPLAVTKIYNVGSDAITVLGLS
jgi:hypothetical protein